MFNKSVLNNIFKLGIKTWLNTVASKIEIQTLKLVLNHQSFGKVDQLYLEANESIYKNLYIKKIILKIFDFNLKLNYKNHIIYSDNILINILLIIDKNNLLNIDLSSKVIFET